jgi:hypothetical protein
LSPATASNAGSRFWKSVARDYSLLLAAYLKARDTFRVADKNYERAQDLFAHHAIADRDLLQAESDRIQAQADLSAAQEGMRILGIPKPEDLEKSPHLSADSVAGAHWRRNRGTPRFARTGNASRHDSGFHHFGHEHGLGDGPIFIRAISPT